ncbi:MAG: YihY/virulence factor BrkB family protein [Lachnospiraceae bacterium]|nr:YihY/virulence factor BrkB family protein [Lachnospiraceae bacterium]
MYSMIKLAKQFSKKIQNDNVNAFAAQSALFTLISFFPLIMVILNLLQFLPISSEEFIELLLQAFPEIFEPYVKEIVKDLYEKSSGTMLTITLITSIWSASKGALSLVRGLNGVYNIEETRNYVVLRMISFFYTIAMIGLVLSSLFLLVLGNTLYQILLKFMPWLRTLLNLFIHTRTIVFLCFMILFFMLIYKAIPARKSSLMIQLPGAVFSSFAWMLFSYAFSFYFNHFGNYSYMYGSLTAIVLIMLWLYFCMYILFLGGEINHFFEPFIIHSRYRIRKSIRQKLGKIRNKK